jgi:hypothetical protein
MPAPPRADGAPMDEPTHPLDGFDLPALRGMLDRFEEALREARALSAAAEGIDVGEPLSPPRPESPRTP